MKRGGTYPVWLSGALVLITIGARVAAAETQANPYAGIVERNVFALKAPPNPEDNKPPPPPPPKILLQGITSIVGRWQVMFKVNLPAKPPEPAKEVALVLSEGQREGEIEIVSINKDAGEVKFINHGVEQTLNIDKDSAKPPPGVVATLGAKPGGLPMTIPPPLPNTAFPQPQPQAQAAMAAGTSVANPGLKTIPTRALRLPQSPAE